MLQWLGPDCGHVQLETTGGAAALCRYRHPAYYGRLLEVFLVDTRSEENPPRGWGYLMQLTGWGFLWPYDGHPVMGRIAFGAAN